jgi:hypothetical protein
MSLLALNACDDLTIMPDLLISAWDEQPSPTHTWGGATCETPNDQADCSLEYSGMELLNGPEQVAPITSPRPKYPDHPNPDYGLRCSVECNGGSARGCEPCSFSDLYPGNLRSASNPWLTIRTCSPLLPGGAGTIGGTAILQALWRLQHGNWRRTYNARRSPLPSWPLNLIARLGQFL